MLENDSRFCFGVRRAALDVCPGLFMGLIGVEEEDELLYILATGGRYLISEMKSRNSAVLIVSTLNQDCLLAYSSS